MNLDIHPPVGQLHEYDIILVAILTTEHFQASDVHTTTIRFNATGAEVASVQSALNEEYGSGPREAGSLAAILHVQGYLRNTPPLHRRLDPYISLCHQGL